MVRRRASLRARPSRAVQHRKTRLGKRFVVPARAEVAEGTHSAQDRSQRVARADLQGPLHRPGAFVEAAQLHQRRALALGPVDLDAERSRHPPGDGAQRAGQVAAVQPEAFGPALSAGFTFDQRHLEPHLVGAAPTGGPLPGRLDQPAACLAGAMGRLGQRLLAGSAPKGHRDLHRTHRRSSASGRAVERRPGRAVRSQGPSAARVASGAGRGRYRARSGRRCRGGAGDRQ